MPLKKVSPEKRKLYEESERIQAERKKREMEEKNTMDLENKNIIREEENAITNVKSELFVDDSKKSENQVTEKVESALENVIQENKNNYDSNSFFKTEELYGTSTAITGFEIELEEEKIIPEGKYRFIVKDLAMENQVSTKYGIKNRLSMQYHISRMIDGEELAFDLMQKYNISNNKNSNFYKMYTDIAGEIPVGKINLRNLLSIKGICEIKHVNMDDGRIFPKIVNLNPEIREVEVEAL